MHAARVIAVAVYLVISALATSARPDEGEGITFERHVRPILKAYCLDCHGGGAELNRYEASKLGSRVIDRLEPRPEVGAEAEQPGDVAQHEMGLEEKCRSHSRSQRRRLLRKHDRTPCFREKRA